jgi:hypothetical protein
MWFSITIISLFLHYISAQAINPDLVVWTTVGQWADLRSCVQFSLAGAYLTEPALQDRVECTTNACLCRADTLGSAEQLLSSVVLAACSDFEDQTTAVSILTSYCAAKGYTSILAPTILPATTGACTSSPTATVTVHVTQYVTVSGANSICGYHYVMHAVTTLSVVVLMYQLF